MVCYFHLYQYRINNNNSGLCQFIVISPHWQKWNSPGAGNGDAHIYPTIYPWVFLYRSYQLSPYNIHINWYLHISSLWLFTSAVYSLWNPYMHGYQPKWVCPYAYYTCNTRMGICKSYPHGFTQSFPTWYPSWNIHNIYPHGSAYMPHIVCIMSIYISYPRGFAHVYPIWYPYVIYIS